MILELRRVRLDDEIMLADCGLLYVFVCFDCYTTTSLIHSG